MTELEPRGRAAHLLAKNRPRIARAIARQVRQLVPRYTEVDSAAHERNAALILEMLERTLGGGSEEALISVLEDLMRLRTAAGFTAADFVVASHCFTPVIRRFFIEREPDLRLANDAYEEVEEAVLAIVGRLIPTALQLGGNLEVDDTAPNRPVRTISEEAPWLMEPITIEPVS